MIFLLGCTVLIALSVLRIVTYWHLHYTDAWNGVSPADFPNYYFPGFRIAEGRPVYADLAPDVLQALGWRYDVYPADPPFTLMVLYPLHFLSYKTAWHLFLIISVMCISASILVCTRALRWDWMSIVTAISLSLSSAPALFLFKRNHMESIVLLLAVLGWRSLVRSRTITLWSVAAALKLFPIAWCIYAGRFFSVRFLLRSLGVVVLLSIVGALFIGLPHALDFVARILPLSSRWYGVVGNYSLLSLFAAFNAPTVGGVLSVIIFLISLHKIFWRGSLDDLFIKSVCFSLMLSPLSWMNYQILLLPILVLLFDRVRYASLGIRLMWYFAALVVWGFPGYLETSVPTVTILCGFIPLYATCVIVALSQLTEHQAE